MRAILQRTTSAHVSVAGNVTGAIEIGFVVLLGISTTDTTDDVEYIARKIVGLRVFADSNGKMNRSLAEISGSILLISQFTLYADIRKGRRPSFDKAAPPEHAVPLYNAMIHRLSGEVPVQTGVFGAKMELSLINDGPVTIILDSTERA